MPLLKFTAPLNLVPPNGLRYRFTEDGFWVRATDWPSFYEQILKHYRDNDYPIPDNWKEIAEDRACKFFPPGWARFDDGSEPKRYIDFNFGVEDFIHGTEVLGHWMLNGRNVVSQEEAENRAETCSRCYANIDIQGCTTCYNLIGRIMEANGGRQTKSEAALRSSCGVCCCSAKAQVWVPIEHLEKGVPESMMELFPSWCWKSRGIREYREALSS